MDDGITLSIKRTITIRAVVTPRWKEDAERELGNALTTVEQQMAQLEEEGNQLIAEIRRQSANPLDPRVQEQVGSVQQQVATKRAELEQQTAAGAGAATSGGGAGNGADRGAGSAGELLRCGGGGQPGAEDAGGGAGA
jgi:hypothetical protein